MDVTGAAGAVDAAVGKPAEVLRPFVRRYLGYRYAGFPPGTHLGLPSPYLTIVVSLGAPTQVAIDADETPIGHATLVGGLHSSPVLLPHDGDQFGVQLDLTPAGARALLGLPAAGIAATVVGLDQMLRPAAAELPERMAAAPDWPRRFAVLDEVLSRRTDRLDPAATVLEYLWHRIVSSGGSLRVGDLAAEVGWSRRHLGARFAAEFGLSPKAAARIVRFDRTRRLLRAHDRPTLAEVATVCGYHDQPHLAREWRQFAGVAPSVWLATDELSFVQDGRDEGEAR
ncbi:MAG: AraC family transcriptional regulator [Dactylosporangium sp.]|nr:AraC family transcriptional regulator [Dactylosporangium sp.]